MNLVRETYNYMLFFIISQYYDGADYGTSYTDTQHFGCNDLRCQIKQNPIW